jgi:prevent-host-death family protein
VFVFENLTNNQKGDLAEAKIRCAAVEHGLTVFEPTSGHARADLIIEVGRNLIRLQVKWGALSPDGGFIGARISGSSCTPNGYVISPYTDEIDVFGIYCGELDRCYLVPIDPEAHKHYVRLRLKPSRNNQRACINLAEQYEFPGAVAQLARASGWQPEGQGFESPQLHLSDRGESAAVNLGSNAFRADIGGVMDRVCAGEEIVITRRGKPRFRMTPLD